MKLIMMMVFFVLIGSVLAKDEQIKPIPIGEKFDTKKVELGKKLFFEPRLSKSGSISCNSCHNLAMGGDDNMKSSLGHKWTVGPINSPTVYNARFHVAQFWDGRAKDLKEQASGPIANPKEMAFTHDLAVKSLKTIPAYEEEFKKAGYKDITIDSIADAIGKFEETLVTPNSRFDKWLKGDKKALTKMEQEGYALFQEKQCLSCHAGVAVGGGSFKKMGLSSPYHDTKTFGRFDVTKNEVDKFVFKVPSLRNIDHTAPYFHDGYTWDLKEAVKMMAKIQYDDEVTDEEAGKIVAFLKTLTGEFPKIIYPLLPPETETTPRPDVN